MSKIIIIFLALMGLFSANFSYARPGIGESFQDWTEYCELLENKQESCHIYQTLTLKGDKTPILSLRVQHIPGKKEPVLFITLQLGVLLSYQPVMELDKQPLKMQFQFCETDGCSAAKVLTEPMLQVMKGSEKFIIKFVNMDRKLIAIPVSLKGFSKGLAKIGKQPKGKG